MEPSKTLNPHPNAPGIGECERESAACRIGLWTSRASCAGRASIPGALAAALAQEATTVRTTTIRMAMKLHLNSVELCLRAKLLGFDGALLQPLLQIHRHLNMVLKLLQEDK